MRRCSSVVTVLVCWLMPALSFATESGDVSGHVPDHGVLLFKMVVVLGGVCLLAWGSLRWGLRRFVQPGESSNMEVVARLPLEPRRSLLVVRVTGRHLMLGTSEAGIQPLGELTEEEAAILQRSAARTAPALESVLTKFRAADVSRETPAGETS